MKTFKYIITSIFIIISFQILAQFDCEEDLGMSQSLYEDGDFENAIKKLEKLLKNCDLNKTQENEALKLIASAYYEMDELEMGNEYVEQFLRKNPFYMASKKNDPYTFRETLEKFKSWARFTFALKSGMPLNYVYTHKIYPISDIANYTNKYELETIIFANFEVSYNLNKVISFYIGSGIRKQNLKHTVPMYNNKINFNYEEAATIINFPAYIQLTLPLNTSFTSAMYFGGETKYIYDKISYSYNYTSDAITDDFINYLNEKRDNVNIDVNHRNIFRKVAIGGIKLIYKINKFTIFADAKYAYDFDLYNNPNAHFFDENLHKNNSYTISDIRIENFDFSLGVSYNIWYKVKEKY